MAGWSYGGVPLHLLGSVRWSPKFIKFSTVKQNKRSISSLNIHFFSSFASCLSRSEMCGDYMEVIYF